MLTKADELVKSKEENIKLKEEMIVVKEVNRNLSAKKWSKAPSQKQLKSGRRSKSTAK